MDEIKLLEPLIFTHTTSSGEQLKITFNKEETGHIGNGVVFRDTSSVYWRYNIDASVELPSKWLKPVDEDKTNVDVNFQNTNKQVG